MIIANIWRTDDRWLNVRWQINNQRPLTDSIRVLLCKMTDDQFISTSEFSLEKSILRKQMQHKNNKVDA